MTVQSMTGFARTEGENDDIAFVWELKSVNGKALDIRVRLPSGFDRLEQLARKAVHNALGRGNVSVTLSISQRSSGHSPQVNEAFLEKISTIARELSKTYGFRPASADGILALRGVLEQQEAMGVPEKSDALDAAMLSSLETAVSELIEARSVEGEALAGFLLRQVNQIDVLRQAAENDPSRQPETIVKRLAAQIELLRTSDRNLDSDRIYTEAALLAAKADIREELDRLQTHVATTRDLIMNGGKIGRKLDFIAQEFIREANTLCSKSNAASITAIGLQMKAVVDQFREQVQNIE